MIYTHKQVMAALSLIESGGQVGHRGQDVSDIYNAALIVAWALRQAWSAPGSDA